jgi:hypothetical protein
MNIGQEIIGYREPMGEFGKRLRRYAPKVRIAIGNDPTWSLGDNRIPTLSARNLPALIDTGSDVTRIDTVLADRLGLTKIGEVQSNFTGVPVPTPVYRAQLCFPEVDFVLAGELPGANLRGSGMFHDFILGLDFLSHFAFLFDQRNSVVTLTFVGV